MAEVYELALWWMSLNLTDDKSTLTQVMDWCHQATSHYLSQWWPRSLSPFCVTRPQWFKPTCWMDGDQNKMGNILQMTYQIVFCTHTKQWIPDGGKSIFTVVFTNACQICANLCAQEQLSRRIWHHSAITSFCVWGHRSTVMTSQC